MKESKMALFFCTINFHYLKMSGFDMCVLSVCVFGKWEIRVLKYHKVIKFIATP